MRTVNAMRPEVYIERLNSKVDTPLDFPKTPATIKVDPIDRDTELAETMFMGLRLLDEGLSMSNFEARYGVQVEDRFENEIKQLVRKGLLVIDGDRLKLTMQARLISNHVFQHFVEPV
jgi:oxygen-independent coproporphyrinogen-3 oxidase